MFANPVFITLGRYIYIYLYLKLERFDMHVFGEKFSESNSRWKPYPNHPNVDQISKTKINSISFSNVDVKQYIFFIKQ